jgi:Tol biopolymer transport system component
VANMRHLVWVDRNGTVQPISLPLAQYNDVRLSPDGSRVVFLVGSSGSGDVWVYDFVRSVSTRLTFDTKSASPVWSRDGKNIIYSEIDTAGNRTTIMRKPADGSREAEAVTSIDRSAYPKAVTADGSSFLFDYGMNTNRGDILQSSLAQGAQPIRLVNTEFNDYAAALSPDERWLAYQSNESGRPEIYVRDLSGAGGRWQVSTEGGEEPRWARDGRTLYFRNGDTFLSAAVEIRPSFQAATPRSLFNGIYNLRSNSGVSYDVDPKGDRFIMIRPAEDTNAPGQVQVVVNWFSELRRIAPTQ